MTIESRAPGGKGAISPDVPNDSQAKSRVRALARALGPRALGWLGIGMGAAFVLAALEVAVALLLQAFLRALGLGEGAVATPSPLAGLGLAPIGAILAAVAALRSLAHLAVARSGNVAMESITARLRRLAVFELLLRGAPGERRDGEARGGDGRALAASRVSALIGEYFVKSSYFAAAGAVLLAACVQALGLAAAMIAGAPRESGIALAGLVVVGFVVHALGKKSRAIAERVPEELSTLTAGIERVARSLLLVRALRTERAEHRRLAGAIDAYQTHSTRATLLGDLAASITPLSGVVLVVFVAIVAERALHTPGLVLLSFFYLFVRFVHAVSLGVSQLGVCNVTAPQLGETLRFVSGFSDDEVASALAPVASAPERSSSRAAAPAGPPEIVVEDASYRYEGAPRDAIAGASFVVPAGAELALLGPSGVGKSTLLALVLGILAPRGGRVTVGGRPPAEYFGDTGVRVGFVGAEPFLVAGTVRDNLRYGLARAASDEELWAALEAAHLAAAIRATAGGLDHGIGEDGSGLSAGQKQRLSLARALLAEPHVLVLDEPTANLDEATEADIRDTLDHLRGKTTTLLVTHRAAFAERATARVRVGPDGSDPPAPTPAST